MGNIAYTTPSGNSVICGGSGPDMVQNISLNKTHTSSSFTLMIQSHSSVNDGGYSVSWGVRDLAIYLNVNCPLLCLSCSGTTCISLAMFAEQDASLQIRCKGGFFIDQTENRCNICHFSCKTCSGIGPLNCTSCFTGDALDSKIFSCNHSSFLRKTC